MPQVQELCSVSSTGIIPTGTHKQILLTNMPQSYKYYVSAVASEKDDFKGYLILAEYSSRGYNIKVYECTPNFSDQYSMVYAYKTEASEPVDANYLSNAVIVNDDGNEKVYFCLKVNPDTENLIHVMTYDPSDNRITVPSVLSSSDSDLQGRPQLFFYAGKLGCFTREQKTGSSDVTLGLFYYRPLSHEWVRYTIPDIYMTNEEFNVINYQEYVYIFYKDGNGRRFIRTDLHLWDKGVIDSTESNLAGDSTIHNGYVRNIYRQGKTLFDYSFDGNQVIERDNREISYSGKSQILDVKDLTCFAIGERLVVIMMLKLS